VFANCRHGNLQQSLLQRDIQLPEIEIN